MMAKRVGIKKGIAPQDSNSFLAPYKPKKERRVTVDRANDIAQFCKQRFPNGMRSRDLFASNGGLEWANRDNIRTPIQKLVTEGRLIVDTSQHPLVFTPKPSRRAQPRRCRGFTKAGTPCKWEIQPWQNHNREYCKWHIRQDPNHWSNHVVDRPDRVDKGFDKPLTPQEMDEVAELLEPFDNAEPKPDMERDVFDDLPLHVITIPPNRRRQGIIIQWPEPDTKYRDLILSFLDGEATIADLREAVRGLQEELKG